MKKNRIAMISFHTCPLASQEGKETGGMNVYVLGLSKALVKKGYEVDMFTRCQNEDNPTIVNISPGLRLMHLPAGPCKPIPKKKLMAYTNDYVKSFKKFTKSQGITYDFLHCHYYLSGLIGLEIKKYYKTRLPIIMSFHTLALMKNLVARDEMEKEEVKREKAEAMLTQKVDRIIAPSENEMNYLMYLYNTPEEKIVVIAPGVDTQLFKPLDKYLAKKKIGADQKDKILLFVGRIEPLKGLDMVLYAIKVLRMRRPELKVCFWIVGGDISQSRDMWSKTLRALTRLKNLLHISTFVKFVGQRPQDELPYYYNSADVVVMPSHYESFGMVALESMACGTPVITTNVAGISSLIDKKHSALITFVNNPLHLAKQIEHLLTNDSVHKQISREILESARELDWKNITDRIIEVYEKL